VTGDVVGQIDGKQREHYHAAHGKHDCNDFARGGDRIDVTAYRREVHRRPPQRVPVGRDLMVDAGLALIEYQRAKVCDQQQDDKISHEQRADGIARQIANDYRHGQCTARQGNKPDEIKGIGTQVNVKDIDEIKIWYRQQQKQ
jgi:hypothetical protein